MQDALNDKDDEVLRASTGLEGGCVAAGSTCGVATGGALGIGFIFDEALKSGNGAASAVLGLVGDFMDRFNERHGNSECRERNGVDFHTLSGQLKYFLSPGKMARCMLLTGETLNHLTLNSQLALPFFPEKETSVIPCDRVHCAQRVLELVKEKTGVGNERLERISIVFDGGVGLKGQLCGAVAASVMAVNLKFGFNVRETGYSGNVHKFMMGHLNLIRKTPKKSTEIFALGKIIVDEFSEKFGSINCRCLTGVDFGTEEHFHLYMAKSDVCRRIIEEAARLAVEVIQIER